MERERTCRQAEFEARCYDGRSSACTAAVVRFDDSDLLILSRSGRTTSYPLSDVTISSRLGNTARILTFPDGTRCELGDNDGLDLVLRQRNANRSHWLHVLESRWRWVLPAAGIALLVTFLTVHSGIPWLAGRTAQALPHSVDRTLGQGTLELLDRSLFTPSRLDRATRTRLTARFAAMVTALQDGNSYRLEFRASEDIGPNAFALPSGIIVITDELVALSENDDELVSIIAHEIGHLEHRHSVRMVLQSSAVALLAAFATGDVVSTSSLVSALPTVLVYSSYSQAFETEADDYAWHYLVDHGIPTVHFANILTRISDEDESGLRHYLSTHPGTRERVLRFRETTVRDVPAGATAVR